MKNKKLDLKFGAEVKELVVQYHKDSFKSFDGKTYSFEEFQTNPKITQLLTQSFRDIQSLNSNERSKRKTNGSIAFGVRKFLKWIEVTGYQGDITYQLLLNYKQSLENENSWTAYSSYAVVARIVLNLMNKGLLQKFLLPNNIPLQQAKNSSKTGVTISSLLSNISTDLSKDDINEKSLSLIIDCLWEDTFELFSKLEKGEQWISEIKTNKYLEFKRGMTKDEAIENMFKNCFIEFNGLPEKYTFSSGFKGYHNTHFIKIFNQYINASKHYKWNIYLEDVAQYFYPIKRLASNIMVLLVASQINPESAMYLKKDCLNTDISSDVTRVSWSKNRSGGEQVHMPFPRGNHIYAKTIPNVIQRYLTYRQKIIDFTKKDFDDLLFIFKHTTQNGFGIFSNEGKHIIKFSLQQIQKTISSKEKSTINDLVLNVINKLNLSIIRTTALNISGKRLNRDMTTLASMDGRKSENVLNEHYLNNAETKQFFDSNIRDSQKLMENWVFEKPVVLEGDLTTLQNTLNISKDISSQIIHDEFNNGYGASLVNEKVIIIDTPLNALRVIQWLEKLKEDKNFVKVNNPERWEYLYAPQIKLFNEALSLMSKKNKQEAIQLNNEINLPFPEVL